MFGTKFRQYNPFAVLGPSIQPRPSFHCWHKVDDPDWPKDSELCCNCGIGWNPSLIETVAENGHGKYKPGAKTISRPRPLDGCL